MSEKTIITTRTLLTTPGKAHQVLLTTFRRNGAEVSTQVGTVSAAGKIYFMTTAGTGKTKRMANNPRITLAPSTMSGKASGPAIEGTARQLFGDEKARARTLLRLGVIGRFWSFIFDRRNPGDKTAVYEVALLAGDEEYQAQKATSV